uniref:C2H2-type domain-containing protein n=1 Tax=Trichogramma kaykai TaxID=54128 RepID=A0ABD2XBG7_9HYME
MVFPRKRGRPSKVDQSIEKSEEIPPNKDTETTSMNKKRGRPRKSMEITNFFKVDKNLSTNSDENASKLESEVSKMDIETSESAVEKLGGPLDEKNVEDMGSKKNTIDDSSNLPTDVDSSSNTINAQDNSEEASKNIKEVGIPKKRRGRPKKSDTSSTKTDVNPSSISVDKTTASSDIISDNSIQNSSSQDRSLRRSRRSATLPPEESKNLSSPDLANESLSCNNVDSEISKVGKGHQKSCITSAKSDASPTKKGVTFSFDDTEKSQCSKNTVEPETPKKRGRPKKTKNIENMDSFHFADVSMDDETNAKNEEQNASPTKSGRDSSLRNRSVNSNNESIENQTISADSTCDQVSEIESDDGNPEELVTRKRGIAGKRGRPRGKRTKRDEDFKPKRMQTSIQSFMKPIAKQKDEMPKPEEPSTWNVTCGKCKEEMLNTQWTRHNLQSHNNLGWQSDKEKPNFSEDQIKKIIKKAHKLRKGSLICDVACKEVMRSVDGYNSHILFCGKTKDEIKALMYVCEICNATMKPASRDYHVRWHKKEDEKKLNPVLTESESTDDQKPKRKAAEKADSKLKEVMSDCKDEKEKVSIRKMKNVIETPKPKKIASIAIKQWIETIAKGEKATCTSLGCNFSCGTIEEIKKHYNECSFRPQQYYNCKKCEFKSLSKEEILNHAVKNHLEENYDSNVSGAESGASESEEEASANTKVVKKPSKKPQINKRGIVDPKRFKFLDEDNFDYRSNNVLTPAFKWTLEFQKEQYSTILFQKNSMISFDVKLYELCNKNQIEECFNIFESINVKTKEKTKEQSEEWKKFKLFENECIKGDPTFFVGGPVSSLAWLPLPSTIDSSDLDQYLAITTFPSMDFELDIFGSYSGKNIIQIWNVGKLHNKKGHRSTPEFSYGILNEGGIILAMEFCPSGCYQNVNLGEKCGFSDDVKSRMGLLAVACSDGCVYIYALDFPENLPNRPNENRERIYKTDPVMTLVLSSQVYDARKQDFKVMRICWTKQKGHTTVVGGLSNGMVAFWNNIDDPNHPWLFERNNRIFCGATRMFRAHQHAITMLHFDATHDILATASLDRDYKVWKTKCGYHYISLNNSRKLNSKKSMITDGAWLNVWGSGILTYDHSLSLNHTYVYCFPFKRYNYKDYNLLPLNSSSYTVAASDFSNGVATGTVAGEILVIFPHAINNLRDMDRLVPKLRKISLVAGVEVHDLSARNETSEEGEKKSQNVDKNQTENDFQIYEDFRNHGLAFNNQMTALQNYYIKNQIIGKSSKKTMTREELKSWPVDQFPLLRVNKVSWNPNVESFLWLASGYQCGFVRLMSFDCVASSDWVKPLERFRQSF